MWDITVVKRRERSESDSSSPPPPSDVGDSALDRVRKSLEAFGCSEFRARARGEHIVIGHGPSVRGRYSVARLTALGRDSFGLAFRTTAGDWEPMLLIDTLDAIVAGVIAAFAVSQDS
jgi:hypothetical protein